MRRSSSFNRKSKDAPRLGVTRSSYKNQKTAQSMLIRANKGKARGCVNLVLLTCPLPLRRICHRRLETDVLDEGAPHIETYYHTGLGGRSSSKRVQSP